MIFAINGNKHSPFEMMALKDCKLGATMSLLYDHVTGSLSIFQANEGKAELRHEKELMQIKLGMRI